MAASLRGNAARQKRHREQQRETGKARLSVWIDVDALALFREAARRRGFSLDEAAAIALAHWAEMMRRLPAR
jgi:hypothetical protein